LTRLTRGSDIRGRIADALRSDHHNLEQMARRVRNPASIGCWRYTQVQPLGSQLVINPYLPIEGDGRNKPPVLAFGNTRPPESFDALLEQARDLYADLEADANPDGIGAFRVAFNEGRIRAMMLVLHARYNKKVILTGHSLGGAMAQIVAANNPDLTHSVVTFQAPGVSLYTAIQWLGMDPQQRDATYHYRVRGDTLIVSAGLAFMPGTVREFVVREVDSNIRAHIELILEPYLRGLASSREISRRFEYLDERAATLDTRREDQRFRNFVEFMRRLWGHGPVLVRHDVDLLRREEDLPEELRYSSIENIEMDADRRGALLRFYRHMYFLAWEYVKDQIRREQPTPQEMRNFMRLTFRMPQYIGRAAHVLLAQNPLQALETELFPSSVPQAREVIPGSWHDNFRQNLRLFFPDRFAQVYHRQDPLPAGELMDRDGLLTPAGIEYIQRHVAADDSNIRSMRGDEIQQIFTGDYSAGDPVDRAGLERRRRYQHRWREAVVEQDVRNHLGVSARGIDSVGHLTSVNPINGFYANDAGDIVITGRRFTTIFDILGRLASMQPELNPTHEPNRSLRQWTVLELLLRVLLWQGTRLGRDCALYRAYLNAHQHFLGCRRSDPLGLIAPRSLQLICCQAVLPEEYGLQQFRGDANCYSQDRNQTRCFGAYEWFTFLFQLRSGTGFVANNQAQAWNAVRQSVGHRSMPASNTPGLKLIRDKEPDIVQILTSRSPMKIEVLDTSFRWDIPWHNFKTEFYASVFRLMFPDASVEALDYRDRRTFRVSSSRPRQLVYRRR
jgi:pimeloyl-ACP methyl ester carboxylesterase